VLTPDEAALMMEQGVFRQPVSICIDAGSSAVQGSRRASSLAYGTSVNHAVLVMGYDVRRREN
jgi:hypothetical protein